MIEENAKLNSSPSDNITEPHFASTEEIIVGSIYLSISIIYCVPYILTMFLIATDKKMMRLPYYHVVVHMGITDIVQLVFNGAASGIFTLLGGGENFWVNKGIGGLMNFCWVIYCFLAHVLAFNRFVNIFWPLHINTVFSMRNTKILICLIWIYGFCWLAAYMSPGFNLVYFIDGYNWDYDFNEISRKAWLVELISDSIHGGCMVIWYACIFIKLKIKLSQISSASSLNEQKKEIKVLMQAFMLCIMVILTIIGFFAIPELTPSRWAKFASNIIWLGCAGNNAMIYIIFNSTVQSNFRRLCRCHRNEVDDNSKMDHIRPTVFRKIRRMSYMNTQSTTARRMSYINTQSTTIQNSHWTPTENTGV